jgi:exonuclease SbcC
LLQLRKLQDRKTKLAATLLELQNAIENNKTQFRKLQLHRQAIEFKPALTEINAYREQVDKTVKELQVLHDQLPSLKTAAEIGKQEFDKARRQEEEIQDTLLQSEPLLEKIIRKDANILSARIQTDRMLHTLEETKSDVYGIASQIKEKGSELKDIETRLSELKTWLLEHDRDRILEQLLLSFRQYRKELEENAAAIRNTVSNQLSYQEQAAAGNAIVVACVRKISELHKEISQADLLLKELSLQLENNLQGKSLEELEHTANDLPALISLCRQQLKLSTYLSKTGKAMETIQDGITGNAATHHVEKEQLQLLESEQAAAEVMLQDLRKMVELQMRIQKYDADRAQLEPENPCPLCGSEHHPYVHEQYQSQVSDAEKKRDKHQQYVHSLQSQIGKKNIDVNTLYVTLQTLKKQKEQLEAETEAAAKEFIQNNLELPKSLDPQKPEVIEAVIRKKEKELAVLLHDITSVRSIREKITRHQNIHADHRHALIQAEGMSGAAMEKINASREQMARLEKETNALKEKYKNILSEIASLLAPYQLDFDYEQVQNIEAELSARSMTYLTSAEKLQQYQIGHAKIKTALEKTSEAIAEKETLHERQQNEFIREQAQLQKLETERFSLFGNKDPQHERDRLNKELKEKRMHAEKAQANLQHKTEQMNANESRTILLQRDTDALREKLDLLTRQLRVQLHEKNIPDIETLTKLFLPEQEVQEIATLEKDLEGNLAGTSQLAIATEEELQKETDKNLTSENEESLKLLAVNSEQIISRLNQEIGRLHQILEEDEKMKIKFREVADSISIQQKECDRWNRISMLIGSADGKKFSRFAQGLTLVRLTVLANRHLAQLSDRYKIIKTPEKDLELQIIDGYQAEVIRPMTTLSGGESFLVSLALALGLSDLASRKVRINSLFIDEGFGTLDADTLDVAISALENLHANGKTIGIISHVEALKDRIGTQIQVSSQPGGISRIRIIGYAGEIENI